MLSSYHRAAELACSAPARPQHHGQPCRSRRAKAARRSSQPCDRSAPAQKGHRGHPGRSDERGTGAGNSRGQPHNRPGPVFEHVGAEHEQATVRQQYGACSNAPRFRAGQLPRRQVCWFARKRRGKWLIVRTEKSRAGGMPPLFLSTRQAEFDAANIARPAASTLRSVIRENAGANWCDIGVPFDKRCYAEDYPAALGASDTRRISSAQNATPVAGGLNQ